MHCKNLSEVKVYIYENTGSFQIQITNCTNAVIYMVRKSSTLGYTAGFTLFHLPVQIIHKNLNAIFCLIFLEVVFFSNFSLCALKYWTRHLKYCSHQNILTFKNMTSAMHENPKIISHLLPKEERNATHIKIV